MKIYLNNIKNRIIKLKHTMSMSLRLTGGWSALIRKIWKIYRQYGWHYLIIKIRNYLTIEGHTRKIYVRDSSINKKSSDTIRLLYIDRAIPKPDQDGGSRDADLLLDIFNSLGYAVTFLPCNLQYEKDYFESLIERNIEVLCYPEVASIDNWLSDNAKNFDICFLSRGPVVWPYLATLKSTAPDTKLIFYTVDLHFLREIRQSDYQVDTNSKTMALKTKFMELELIKQCDLTITLSNEELYTIRNELYQANLIKLPVIFNDFPGAKSGFSQRKDILFIGNFTHQPNIDSVMFFANKIFPLIHIKHPDICFKIVGADAPKQILKLQDTPGIKILGYVRDLEPVMESIRVTIAPIRYGAGIKGKIGTSFCYGIPCVATDIAVEGMNLTNGHNIMQANTPEEFAQAVIRTYSDEQLWMKLSHNGLKFIKEYYSFDVIKRNMRSILYALQDDWQFIESSYELDNWNAWQQHENRMSDIYADRYKTENALIPTNKKKHFYLAGYCTVCKSDTRFLTTYTASSDTSVNTKINWREQLLCEHCGLSNRTRAALNALHTYYFPLKHERIYITEQVSATYHWLKGQYTNTTGSEYFGEGHIPGSYIDGIRHENIQQLSFDDNSFDFVLSFDVLEHITDYMQAFQEIYRILDKDGIFLFTVPFAQNSFDNIIRASVNSDGQIEHHLEPEYHGNPIDPVFAISAGKFSRNYVTWDSRARELLHTGQIYRAIWARNNISSWQKSKYHK